jgi:hypothetical protein
MTRVAQRGSDCTADVAGGSGEKDSHGALG